MRQARYDDAWEIAAAVLQQRDNTKRDDPLLPFHKRWVWDGSPFDGRNVVVRSYHGLGDTLQFCRFLPLLAQRAATVTLEVQQSLVDLLAAAKWPINLVGFDEREPLACGEVDLEITELDFALRAAPERAAPPYLKAPRAILPPGTIALCHRAGTWDCDRSVPEELLAPICKRAPCVTLATGASRLKVLNRRGCPVDMSVTAALVAQASLVVTVDTMAAHLAGALGKPTWLLLKANPDWRWPIVGSSSAWYPQMRIYRQVLPEDWETVIRRVTHDLEDFSEEYARSFT